MEVLITRGSLLSRYPKPPVSILSSRVSAHCSLGYVTISIERLGVRSHGTLMSGRISFTEAMKTDKPYIQSSPDWEQTNSLRG